MSSYNELVLSQKINSCIDQLHQILQSNKTGIALKSAENVSHRYDDKYLLAEQVTGFFAASALNVLNEMGLQGEHLSTVLGWIREGEDVNMRFERNHHCVYVKETTREEESATQYVTEKTGMFNQKTVSKAVTRITEYHYTFGCHVRLVAYKGYLMKEEEGGTRSALVLLDRRSEQGCIVRTKAFPYPEQSKSHFTMKLTWLLQLLGRGENGHISYQIDRSRSDCFTPRRNEDVERALRFASELSGWVSEVNHYLSQELLTILQTHDRRPEGGGSSRLDGGNLWDVEDILMPVIPIFQDREASSSAILPVSSTSSSSSPSAADETAVVAAAAGSSASTVMLDREGVGKIVAGQQSSLEAKLQEVVSVLQGNAQKLISGLEGKLIVCLRYLQKLVNGYRDSVDYIESMLRNQLIAAIGKIVTPWDFGEYMKFHYRKMMKEVYQPRAFSYAVRRSAVHSPEGTVRIEIHNREGSSVNGGERVAAGNNLLMTTCRDISNAEEWTEFAINASTKIRVGGERYVHGWLGHGFSNDAGLPELKLVTETRQFSSYIVLLGRMIGKHEFDAQHAFIVQNKDLMTIPLLLETIPTPKQFRDAIESLSPEQQAFAKAYRSMQLASTLFGMMVIQIKPQLEKVLNLDGDSLTKEIKLTQDLMKLFIEYQIPSDLLSYDGRKESSGSAKINRVKELVDGMMTMIKEAKGAEIEEKNRERQFNYGSSSAPPSGGFAFCSAPTTTTTTATTPFAFGSAPTRSAVGGFGAFPGAQPTFAMARSAPQSANFSSFSAAPAPMAMSFSSSMPPPPPAASFGFGAAPQQAQAIAGFSAAPPAPPAPMAVVAASAPVAPTHIIINPPPESKPTTEPAPTQQPQQVEKSQHDPSDGDQEESVDVTKLPTLLDARYETYDLDNALRPAIVNVGEHWEKTSQKSLLSAPSKSTLGKEAQGKERNAAFDLLDALTRSGGLTVDHGQLHVVIAGLHRFDQSLMDTLIQKNVNPISRVERSYLLMTSTLQGVEVLGMVEDGQRSRVAEHHQHLLTME